LLSTFTHTDLKLRTIGNILDRNRSYVTRVKFVRLKNQIPTGGALQMVKKPQSQKEQLDTEDEVLNFDLEELAGDEVQPKKR